MSEAQQGPIPYFNFTTVRYYGKINNMHDDSLHHRARVEYFGERCWIQCSCAPHNPWVLEGDDVNEMKIQQSFEAHLAHR